MRASNRPPTTSSRLNPRRKNAAPRGIGLGHSALHAAQHKAVRFSTERAASDRKGRHRLM